MGSDEKAKKAWEVSSGKGGKDGGEDGGERGGGEGKHKGKGESKGAGSPEDRARARFQRDREEVYKPLHRHLRDIHKGVRARERDIPMGRIARMQVSGLFTPDHLKPLYEDVRRVLVLSKDYVEHFWNLQKKIRREFVSQMERDGIHTTTTKEFVSLQNSAPDAVIGEDGKTWAMSYDTYIPRMRETARKTSRPDRDGETMYGDMVELFEPEMTRLKELQRKVAAASKALMRKVKSLRWDSPEYKPGL